MTVGFTLTNGYIIKIAWIVKLANPIDLQSPFSLHYYNTFQATIIDCLLGVYFSSSPSSTGGGGGVVGQFSITKSKYYNFISWLDNRYVIGKFWCI